MTLSVTTEAATYRSPLIIDTALAMRRRGYLGFWMDLWQKHGDFVRVQIGSNEMYMAIHPELVRYISITNRKNYDKRETYDVVRKLLLGDGLVTSTGALWRRQRKLMAPFFSPRGVHEFYPQIVQDAIDFRTRWENKLLSGETHVEMMDEMMLVTALIILRTMFSIEETEEILSLKDDVETMIQFASTRELNPLSAPLWIPTRKNTDYHQARERVHNYINGVIASRRAIPEDEWPDDLLTRLMTARDEETGEAMSDKLLLDESITMFFAGHETTARTMTFAWYALSKNPEVAAKLHEEVDTVLGDRVPEIDDLKQMPYTLRIIKETLRLYPPAPMYARDAIDEDVIDGVPIPPKSRMLLMPFITHRHPEFWDEPEVFNPDRFDPAQEKERHPYAYHPFAAGQRVCIGNNFSLFESHILLSMLARRFAPRMAEGHEPQLDMAGTLFSRNGMPMMLEARN